MSASEGLLWADLHGEMLGMPETQCYQSDRIRSDRCSGHGQGRAHIEAEADRY